MALSIINAYQNLKKYGDIIDDFEKHQESLQDQHKGFAIAQRTIVPWVRVGSLYMSPIISGNEGWIELAKKLFEKNKTDIYVFSGRHGAPEGQTVRGMPDDDLFRADQEALSGNNLSYIKLINTNCAYSYKGVNYLSSTPYLLKELTKKILDDKHIVIYAWCFSLSAMKIIDRDNLNKINCLNETERIKKADEMRSEMRNKTLGDISYDFYFWVPRNRDRSFSFSGVRYNKVDFSV